MRTSRSSLLALLVLAGLPAAAAAQTKLSGIGDSISQGYNAYGCLWFNCGDQPAYAFGQGTSSAVQSIYTRYRALGLLAGGEQFASVSGAEMVGGSDNAAAQASRVCAQAQKPDRIVLLLGGNDVCNRGSAGSLYSATTYRNALRAGLDILGSASCGLPAGTRVQVLSMPRVDGLRDAGLTKQDQDGTACSFIWWVASVCRVVTGEASAAVRAQIGAAIDAYNAALAEEVAAAEASYGASRGIHFSTDWRGPRAVVPNTSVGSYQFGWGDLDSKDCFHPKYSTGQKKLACTAWERGELGGGAVPTCLQ